MRSAAVLAAFGLGCSYPEFHFSGQDADTAIGDVLGEDSAGDTALADVGGDAFTEETRAPEADAAAADTSATDTRVADSGDSATVDALADTTPISNGCTGSTAKYCFDWDDSTTVGAGFSYDGLSPTASNTVDTTGGRSKPNAFLATTSPGTGDIVVATLTRTFVTTAPDALIKLDAWLKLEADKYPSTTGGAAFFFKLQRDAGEGDGVTFGITPSGFYTDRIGVTYASYGVSYVPKIGTWMHVRLHARLHTTAGSLTLWIDNMTTPIVNVSSVSTARMDGTLKNATVGLFSQKSSGTVRARFDDVQLDY